MGGLATRLDRLTALRFAAAAGVMIYHAGILLYDADGPVWAIGRAGFLGVEFFFVLSGFVLTWSLDPTVARRHFYGRRIARIYPLYLVTALIAVAVRAWLGNPSGLPESVANLLVVQAWPPLGQYVGSLNPVAWTISCEAFFYAVFPFVVSSLGRVRHRTRGAVSIGVSMTAVLVLLVLSGHEVVTQNATLYGPWYRIGSFLIGILLAHAVRRGRRLMVPLPLATGSLLGVALLVTIWLEVDGGERVWSGAVANLAALPCCCLVIAAAATADLELDRPPPPRWAVRLGDASFALYLSHYLVLLVVAHLTRTWSTNPSLHLLLVVTTLGLCVGASVILHDVVERPGERWLRDRLCGPRRTR